MDYQKRNCSWYCTQSSSERSEQSYPLARSCDGAGPGQGLGEGLRSLRLACTHSTELVRELALYISLKQPRVHGGRQESLAS